MKNSFNPYTVPGGFFDEVCRTAVARYRRQRRILGLSLTGTAIALVVLTVTVPSLLGQDRTEETAQPPLIGNTLAGMYEYDVFLQVTF